MSETTDIRPWRQIDTAPEGVEVLTKIDDEYGARNEQTLRLRGRLWWYPDGSMYVYYTPTHWLSIGEAADAR